MAEDRPAGLSTRAVHSGEDVSLPERRPAAVPIYQTAPWTFASADDLDRTFAAVPDRRSALYSRYENPTVRALERKLAALEGAEDAVAVGSGMAAVASTLGALLASGDRLLAAAEIYGGTEGWLAHLALRHPEVTVERAPLAGLAQRLDTLADTLAASRDGDRPTPLDSTSRAGAAVADRAPAVVYLETPSNPALAVCDLAAVTAAARRLAAAAGRLVRVVVDGTFASPVVQRPLSLGADLVLHSATKFLAGHSDVTAGLVAGGADLVERVRSLAITAGAVLDPHAAFLVARGMKTLALRVERQSVNAARLAELLAGHPAVVRVDYPGRPSSSGSDGAFDPVAAGQMASGGAMLAFELAGGLPAARRLVDALRVIRILPSLGGVESGVVLPALSSHRGLSPEQRAEAGIPDGLVRVSCGIEDGDDLAADLEQALGVLRS